MARLSGKVFSLKIKRKQENKETQPERNLRRGRRTISLFLFVFKKNLLYHAKSYKQNFPA